VPRYLVLLAPSSNRVYAGDAPRLVGAELALLADGCFAGAITDVEVVSLAGVPYVQFVAESIGQRELDLLSNVSARFGVFERLHGDTLRPVEVTPIAHFDDDLLSIPKYQGKTNEQLTKLLLNVTLAATAWAEEFGTRRFSVLDPLAGRCTTLDQALTYGFDAAGIEIEEREVDAYATFFSTYLKRKRLKHTFAYAPVRREGKKAGKRLDAEVNTDAAAFKAGERQTLTVHVGDTLKAAELFGKRRFDVIVTDAPYGVVHGSRAGGTGAAGGGGRERNAADLLRQAVPVWASLLRPGGAMGIAWNTLGLERDRLADVLSRAGLRVAESTADSAFEHRVDSSIVRDVIVARKG
jgi:hypothetical protein